MRVTSQIFPVGYLVCGPVTGRVASSISYLAPTSQVMRECIPPRAPLGSMLSIIGIFYVGTRRHAPWPSHPGSFVIASRCTPTPCWCVSIRFSIVWRQHGTFQLMLGLISGPIGDCAADLGSAGSIAGWCSTPRYLQARYHRYSVFPR